MLGLFNIITILLIIHVVLYKLGPKNPGLLACGLFAYISARDNCHFNWDKFNALGLDNDERGGDSVGRAVGDDIRKFVNNRKAQTTYKDYVINHKNGDPYHIALGHTRKASIGAVSESTAQPVVIDVPDLTNVDGTQGRFIMVHNGTIYNWEDLAKKYNVSTVGKSDSMVLGEIIYNHGYDVLLEYQGAAAIIIRDDREPDTIKVFRGQSKSWNKLEDERPLFFYPNLEDGDMYISSREEGLYFIGADGGEVIEFDPNVLFTIKDGEIVKAEKYDRSNCSQTRIYNNNVQTTTYGQTTMYATRYSGEDSYDDFYKTRNLPSTRTVTASRVEYNIKNDVIYKPAYEQRISAARLRYYFHDKNGVPYLANGPVWLTQIGDRYDGPNKSGCKEYFFYCGIMMKDEASYNKVKQVFGRARKFVDNDKNISNICKYAAHPVCTIVSDTPSYSNVRSWEPFWDNDLAKDRYIASLYTGDFQMLFGIKKYTFNHGIQTGLTWCDEPLKAKHDWANNVIPAITYSERDEYSVWVEKYCEIDDDDNDLLFTPDKPEKTIDQIIYEQDEPNESIEEQNDSDFESEQLEKYALDALSDGLKAILIAVDSVIMDIENTGLNGKKIAKVLSNLYACQDIFIDEKITNNNLIASYEEF